MSEKLYKVLLKLYPEHFRRTYGEEALRLVRDRARGERGFRSGLRLGLDLLLDLAASLPREYRRARTSPIAAAQIAGGEGSFPLLAERPLSPALLCLGAMLSATFFWVCAFVVVHSNGFPILLGTPLSLEALAQSATASEKHLAFEVVSIRRHTAASGPVENEAAPDGYRWIGLPMFAIFQAAYVLPNQSGVLRGNQIEGDPNWLSTELYDVVAKVGPEDLADWQKPQMRQTMLREMLQTVLAERCKAVTHYGSKEASVYDLVIAKGGPKFQRAEAVDAAELRQKHPTGGMMRGSVTMAVQSPERTQYYAMPMALLANTILSSLAGRPVINKTGLTGYYDLALPSAALRPQLPPPPPGAPAQLEEESIFTALPEALGLRLLPSKGQAPMLVIDHVERPSEN